MVTHGNTNGRSPHRYLWMLGNLVLVGLSVHAVDRGRGVRVWVGEICEVLHFSNY